MSGATTHLFLLNTGFHYYFSKLLIAHLKLEHVAYAMYLPREGIQHRAAENYPVVFADGSHFTAKFGKKVGKVVFASRVFKELNLAGSNLQVYSPYYNDTFVYRLRDLIARAGIDVEYSLIPDAASLLRPRPPLKKLGRYLWATISRAIYKAPEAELTHRSGSYSDFIKTIYHFPASKIYATQSKIEIVPVPPSDKNHNDEILIVGGLSGISRELVLKVLEKSQGRNVKYRMHPKNNKGLEYIRSEAPTWQELSIPGALTLEEYLQENPFYKVIGSYSSALVFNHLFISASSSEFMLDAVSEDKDWHGAADSCGIPVTLL